MTAIIYSTLIIAAMYFIVKYFERKKKKDLAEAERHKREFLDYLLDLDEHERKIS